MDGVNEFRCEICDISVNSERILEDHNRGKKHQKNLELQQSNSYCKTIRVCDFPPGQYAKEMLWQYFERYGPIDDVEIDYWNPGVGYVTYKKPGSTVTCLNQKKHVIDEYTIWIEPVDTNFASPQQNKPKKEQKLEPKANDEIINRLLQEPDVESQMKWLTKELEMKVMDSTVHKNLTDSLQEIFTHYFPGCVVYRFGSSLNGMGARGCDLDVFLDLNLDKPLTAQQARKLPRPYPNVADIESFRNMRGRFMSRDELSRVPLFDQVKLAGKILLQEGNSMGVNEIQSIPSNRCPVVRFRHGPSNVLMDLTLNNRAALRNTQLLLLYQQIEPRLRPLVFTLRHWGRAVDILGSANVGQKLSTYALIMMIVFYLQNTKPRVLVSVQELADMSSPDDRISVSAWDCSFTSNKKKIPASTNQQSMVELLCGFFEFYSEFDFVNRLICPRLGRALPLADLGVEFKVAVMNNYRVGPVCIQDVFVLDHNPAQNINEGSRNKLLAALKSAAAKVRTGSFTNPGELQAWGLPYLFSAEAITLSDTALPSKQTKHVISVPMTFGSCPKLFTIAVMLKLDLSEAWCQYVANAFQYILEEVLLVEVEVLLDRTNPQLKIGVVEVDKESGKAKTGQKRPASTAASQNKKQRVETPMEGSEDPCTKRLAEMERDASTLLVLKCRINDRVWINRKNFAGKAALKSADIAFETAVSRQLIQSAEAKMYCPIEFMVEVRQKLEPCQVICGLELTSDESSKSDFNTFAAFLEVFHVKIMNQL